jgi:hypothetical protein
MANYIVFAREPNTMRADRRNAIFVTADDADAARAAAEALVGPAAGALDGFEVLDLASAPDFVVRGHQPTRGVTGDVL